MTRNLRGRLARLERAAPAQATSILANGRFWDMLGGVSGDCSPAELAEWETVWRRVDAAQPASDFVEHQIVEAATADSSPNYDTRTTG